MDNPIGDIWTGGTVGPGLSIGQFYGSLGWDEQVGLEQAEDTWDSPVDNPLWMTGMG